MIPLETSSWKVFSTKEQQLLSLVLLFDLLSAVRLTVSKTWTLVTLSISVSLDRT